MLCAQIEPTFKIKTLTNKSKNTSFDFLTG